MGWLIPYFMLANRLRGSSFAKWGKPVVYVSYTVFAYLMSDSYVFAGIVLVGSLIEWTPGWGAWFDLGKNPVDHDGPWGHADKRWDDTFVKVITFLGGGNDYICLFIRHLFVAPMVFATYWWFQLPLETLLSIPLFSAFVVLSYHIGWKSRSLQIENGEYLSGAVWGCLIIFLIRMIS